MLPLSIKIVNHRQTMNKRKLIQNVALSFALVLNILNAILAQSLVTRLLYCMAVLSFAVYFVIELTGGDYHKRD